LIDTGHGVPINDKKWSDLRESYDLNSLPPTVHSHPEAVKEIQTLVKSLKFDKLVEYKSPNKKDEEKSAKSEKKPSRKGRKSKSKK
jgi:heterodisulfide reductase subunit C